MRVLLMFIIMLGGCSTTGVNREDQNLIIKQFYASVVSITPVKLSSDVQLGIAGGATMGFLDALDGNHEEMIAGTIAGAIVGGLFTAIFEGNNRAFEYVLHSPTEGDFTIIQKEKIDINSSCVAVKLASHVSIKSAANEQCLELSNYPLDNTVSNSTGS